MKKIGFIVCILIGLSGCISTSSEDVHYQTYKTNYQNILNTTSFQERSSTFDISAELSKVDDNSVRYDVFLDNPKIAMYDVEILAIVDKGLLTLSSDMMPSVGIFEDAEYNLIPFQVNGDKGFPKGFNLNGITTGNSVVLKVQVTWKDYFKIRSYKENFKFELKLS